MKTLSNYKITILLTVLLLTSAIALSQQITDTVWTAKNAKKWVKSRAWSNGNTLKAHPSVNKIEFANQYHANKTYWEEAFKFIRDKNLNDLAPGKYVIDGDSVYALVTDGPSKDFEQSKWESHRNYIDLQYVIRGKEKIGVAPMSSATVTSPYDAIKDLANYDTDGKFYIAAPGTFFLFFPADAHRPGIKVKGYDTDKKLVIKIRYHN
jgi:YhcH/YjgK/YiaL family protein